VTAPSIGIMQGRLLPPVNGRFQAFPAVRWREEFPKAAAAGLSCIEWIFEKPEEERNPLRHDEGLAEVARIAVETNVEVRSICADYYMTEQLLHPDGSRNAANVAHLEWLLGRVAQLKVTYVVLPFVDSSALKTPERIAGIVGVLREIAPCARRESVELHIECDLPPPAFRDLLDRVAQPNVKANYDIGNSASLGYHPRDELPAIGPYLGSVHVKDRQRAGGTVSIGGGAADLPEAFRQIRSAGFARWLILQVAREEELDHVALARRNRLTVERLWAEAA
jgi:L-ribulose-5-phosphate 3-epimerase